MAQALPGTGGEFPSITQVQAALRERAAIAAEVAAAAIAAPPTVGSSGVTLGGSASAVAARGVQLARRVPRTEEHGLDPKALRVDELPHVVQRNFDELLREWLGGRQLVWNEAFLSLVFTTVKQGVKKAHKEVSKHRARHSARVHPEPAAEAPRPIAPPPHVLSQAGAAATGGAIDVGLTAGPVWDFIQSPAASLAEAGTGMVGEALADIGLGSLTGPISGLFGLVKTGVPLLWQEFKINWKVRRHMGRYERMGALPTYQCMDTLSMLVLEEQAWRTAKLGTYAVDTVVGFDPSVAGGVAIKAVMALMRLAMRIAQLVEFGLRKRAINKVLATPERISSDLLYDLPVLGAYTLAYTTTSYLLGFSTGVQRAPGAPVTDEDVARLELMLPHMTLTEQFYGTYLGPARELAWERILNSPLLLLNKDGSTPHRSGSLILEATGVPSFLVPKGLLHRIRHGSWRPKWQDAGITPGFRA